MWAAVCLRSRDRTSLRYLIQNAVNEPFLQRLSSVEVCFLRVFACGSCLHVLNRSRNESMHGEFIYCSVRVLRMKLFSAVFTKSPLLYQLRTFNCAENDWESPEVSTFALWVFEVLLESRQFIVLSSWKLGMGHKLVGFLIKRGISAPDRQELRPSCFMVQLRSKARNFHHPSRQ